MKIRLYISDYLNVYFLEFRLKKGKENASRGKKNERYASRGKWCFECDSPLSKIADKIVKTKESLRLTEMCCTLRVESGVSSATRIYRKSLKRLQKRGKFTVYEKKKDTLRVESGISDVNLV